MVILAVIFPKAHLADFVSGARKEFCSDSRGTGRAFRVPQAWTRFQTHSEFTSAYSQGPGKRGYRPNCGRLPLCGLILVEIDLTLRGLNRELPIRRAGQIGNDEKHQRDQRRECY